MAHRYDAVVVGAGPNGLVAANLLVDAGWSVVVLEDQPEPGGAVRSAADHPAPGYTADLFSAFYPLAAASPVLAAMRLDEHGLRLGARAAGAGSRLRRRARPWSCRATSRRPPRAWTEFAAGDGDAWRRWVRRWREVEQPALDALLRPFPPVRPALSMARRLGPARALRTARLGVLPTRTFVREEFRGEGAALLVAGNAMHTDLGPESAEQRGLRRCCSRCSGRPAGFPVPRGGAGRLTDALVSRLRSRGGELRCGSAVTSVLVGRGRRRGRRAGVAASGCARGLRARRRTGAAPLPLLVGEARLPERLRRDLDRFHWDNAHRQGQLGDVRRRSRGATRRSPAPGTVHLGGGLDDLTRVAADLATGRVPERPFVLLGQMTTTDPTRSPAGTESVWAYAHLPHGDHPPEVDGRLRRDRIEDEVERQAPGFRDLVRRPVRAGAGGPAGRRPGPRRRRARRRHLGGPPAAGLPAHPRARPAGHVRSPGCSSPAPRRTPAAACTVPAAPTPPGPHCSGRGWAAGRTTARWAGSQRDWADRAATTCRPSSSRARCGSTV